MNLPFDDLKARYYKIKFDIESAIAAVTVESAFIKGKFVSQVEMDFWNLHGTRNVLSYGNGTDYLYIIMKMLVIGQGDEVITAAIARY